MPPQKVNAYYNSTMNEIVFPAAILQPPFFDPDADPAVNYGGIGGVIGHEISHGFDDQGRKSNGDGVLKDWWTSEDAARFNQRSEKLGAQYEATEILPGQKINGKLTMGENIGDLGGINLALGSSSAGLKFGGKKSARKRSSNNSTPILIPRPRRASTSSCGMSTPGTTPSTSSRATSSI
jgi:putative endopeptidase